MNKQMFDLLKSLATEMAEDAIKSNTDNTELKFTSLVILIDDLLNDIRHKTMKEELTDIQKESLVDTMSKFLNDSKAILQISVVL